MYGRGGGAHVEGTLSVFLYKTMRIASRDGDALDLARAEPLALGGSRHCGGGGERVPFLHGASEHRVPPGDRAGFQSMKSSPSSRDLWASLLPTSSEER